MRVLPRRSRWRSASARESCATWCPARTGRWQFTPEKKPSAHDGLPEDAWTGFLKTRDGMVSTREGARPFSVEEQRRILTVGACLTCHAGDSPVMTRALADFAATLAARSRRCARRRDGKP